MKTKRNWCFAFCLWAVCLLLLHKPSYSASDIIPVSSNESILSKKKITSPKHNGNITLTNCNRNKQPNENPSRCKLKTNHTNNSVSGNGCSWPKLQSPFVETNNSPGANLTIDDKEAQIVNSSNVKVLTESVGDCLTQFDFNGSFVSENNSVASGKADPVLSNSKGNALNGSDSQNVLFDSLPSNRSKIRIWDKGVLKRDLLNRILTHFRRAITVPVFISLVSVALTVAVFRDKDFKYQGKAMVISFNIFEGLKCAAFLLFRMMKLNVGDSKITWNSTYATFFIYYVMWFPLALGRIGILHNALITLDRFFTIAFPIRRLNKRLVTRPKICVAVIVGSMFVYQIAPVILFFHNVEPFLDREKTFSNDEIISEIYLTNPAAFRRYWLSLTIGHALFVYIPLFVALVCNTLTIISLWRHERARASLTQTSPSPDTLAMANKRSVKRQTNTMIVGPSLVFAILVLFRRLLPLIALFTPDFGQGRQEMHLYILSNEIVHFFDCVSPLVNIISYTTLSTQFRCRLKQIVLPVNWFSKAKNDNNI